MCELISTIESGDSGSDLEVGDDTDSDEANLLEPPRKKRSSQDRTSESKNKFTWVSDQFVPKLHTFDNKPSGFHSDKLDMNSNSSVLEHFECFVTNDLAGKIAAETNRYFSYVTQNVNRTQFSRLNKWSETDWQEIYLFLAVTMLISRNKKLKLNDCWSTDPLLHTPIFGKVMSRDRYLLLLRLLHFCNNEEQEQNNRLHKLEMIISELKQCFKNNFTPFENLCIDESLVLFKGRLSFKQYIKTKRHKFGVKLFVLADCETDYVLDFIIYTGATTNLVASDPDLGISGAVVLTLMQPYLNLGHNLYTDNWYTSPILADYLHKQGTNLCGTVRGNRRGMPKFEGKLERGKSSSQHTQTVMVTKWADRRDVLMLTTLHADVRVSCGKVDRNTGVDIVKPLCVKEYNAHMGSIDKVDMLLSSVECLRKTIKWYKKIFFHLVDLAVLNTHAMYKVNTGKNISIADFQLQLTREIIAKYGQVRPTTKSGRPSSGDLPARLTARHFPQLLPAVDGGRKNPQRVCHVCKHTLLGPKKRKDSRYFCKECDVGLCVYPCFEKFHTLKKY